MASSAPKVSIVTIAYNQERYIRAALDSFVAQQANFDIEVIVADDGSTDGTPGIIEEYAKAHPGMFRPILRKQNIGAIHNSIDALQAARGQYVALCEGDDYWTDPHKLQKQADFLDKHPDYSVCFHRVKVVYEDHNEPEYLFPDPLVEFPFTSRELLKRNFIQTNSVMYRRQPYDQLPDNVMPLDWYLHLYHARSGKIGFINDVMSVYRRHACGIWWNAERNSEEIWQHHGLAHIALYAAILKLYEGDDEARRIVSDHISIMFEKLLTVDQKQGTGLVRQALGKWPDAGEIFVLGQDKALIAQTKEAEDLDRTAKQEIHERDKRVEHLNRQLRLITSSKTWRLRGFLLRLVGRR